MDRKNSTYEKTKIDEIKKLLTVFFDGEEFLFVMDVPEKGADCIVCCTRNRNNIAVVAVPERGADCIMEIWTW